MPRLRPWQALACLATSSCWLIAGVEDGRLGASAGDAGVGTVEAAAKDGGRAPVVVATKQDSPAGIAVDTTYLYWTNNVAGGNVMRCGLPDCTGLTALATEQTPPFAIVTDRVGGVFWATTNDVRASLDGGPPFSDAPGPDVRGVTGLAFVGGSWTYLVASVASSLRAFYDDAHDANIITGTEESPHAVVGDQGGPSPGAIYWVSGAGLRRQCVGEPADCASESTVATLVPKLSAHALALDPLHVFWVDDVGGTLSSTPRAGGDGGVLDLASRQDRPWSLAVDAQYVYFTSLGGQVARLPKNGGPLEVLADHQAQPWAIALTSDSVYWTNNGDGTVMRRAK